METRHPATKLQSLPAQTLAERLLYAAAVLHIGGFMTDAERRTVHKRMMKWKAATVTPVAPKPTQKTLARRK